MPSLHSKCHPPTPLHLPGFTRVGLIWVLVAVGRLFNVVAEVTAVQDAYYYLSRALANNPNLSLDFYLKEVRILAKRQFEHQALAKKISEALARAQGFQGSIGLLRSNSTGR